MDDRELKSAIIRLLNEHEFEVSEIPGKRDSKTPDLYVIKDNAHYIIEIKSRQDNIERTTAERAAFVRGEVVSKSETINRTNAVSAIVGDAIDQLRTYPASAHSFRLIWLHADGRDAELQMMQFRGTLYGLTHIYDMTEEHDNRECYYFGFNDFFRYKDVLDGAILTAGLKLQVCINDLSPNATRFRAREPHPIKWTPRPNA
ncbi:MAG: hypothetical protein HYS46_04520 [Betaproteobacteria bacterium]|nr:hypothetical protein [Betaproteobacteria bacterium]